MKLLSQRGSRTKSTKIQDYDLTKFPKKQLHYIRIKIHEIYVDFLHYEQRCLARSLHLFDQKIRESRASIDYLAGFAVSRYRVLPRSSIIRVLTWLDSSDTSRWKIQPITVLLPCYMCEWKLPERVSELRFGVSLIFFLNDTLLISLRAPLVFQWALDVARLASQWIR